MHNYKIFINNSLIFFGEKEDLPLAKINYSDFKMVKPSGFKELVRKIESYSELDHYFVETEDVDSAFRYFSSFFKVLQAAGGLVLNHKDEILMIHRFDHWDFPKGHVEKDEELKECAIREVMEETGVEMLEITSSLPEVFHIYDYKNKWVLKETHWYMMYSEYTGILQPQLEENIIAAKWVPLDFLNEYMNQSYPGLYQLVKENNLLR